MTPKQREAAEHAIRAFVNLDGTTKTLIRLANTDLYSGPLVAEQLDEEDGWPGFVKACEAISNALPSGDLWVDLDCDYVTDTEPEWCDGCSACDDGEHPDAQNPESWCRFDARAVKVALVGSALADYL